MGDKTAIEWTDASWNPVVGCTKVSTGCKFCYAERVSKRMGQEFTKVTLHPERLEQPLRWRKPRRIFVNSMSDLFHEAIPDEFIDRVFEVAYYCKQHTFQILTKRAERMQQYMDLAQGRLSPVCPDLPDWPWPLPNVWLGVSCENQEQADKRIPLLLKTPAAVRFVSLEPLLGPIELRAWFYFVTKAKTTPHEPGGIDWVIVGGESGGPPERALVRSLRVPGPISGLGQRKRTMLTKWTAKPEALEWVRSIRDQCQAAGVAFYFKQWGGPRPKSGGRVLDGRTWDEYPNSGK